MNSGCTCVYCGQGTDLTNEHIIPDCYHKTFNETISIVKTHAGDKAIPNPQEVGDVCATCNNGPLSCLDSYFAVLNDTYFSKIVHAGDRVRFRYEFDLLFRFMLKVAYNVARTRKWPLGIFQDASQYIIGEKPRPSEFRIFLQLMIPTPVTKTNLTLALGTKEVPPLPWHADLYDVSSFPGLAFACSISFMSYRFFILREDMKITAAVRERSMKSWLKGNWGAYELTSIGDARLYASSVTVLNAVEGDPTFRNQLTMARKLKANMKLGS